MRDNEAARRKAKAMLARLREDTRPLVQQLIAAVSDSNKAVAADLGEPYSDANERYFRMLGNITQAANHMLNSGSPELHSLHDLAKTVTPRQRDQWTEAKGILEWLFENLDGREQLGLGALLMLEPDGNEARADILRECAIFHKVPPNYIPALDEAVDVILKAHGGWQFAPQHWATIYAYSVGAMVTRCTPD